MLHKQRGNLAFFASRTFASRTFASETFARLIIACQAIEFPEACCFQCVPHVQPHRPVVSVSGNVSPCCCGQHAVKEVH